jgi:nucleotide-binding universal stress UspA family protein
MERLRKFLIPTDGSELSERALPPAVILARSQEAEVTVVTVLEPIVWAGRGFDWSVSPDLYQQLADQLSEEARASTAALVNRIAEQGVQARAEVLNGVGAAALLDFEQQMKPDLIVMASHGRTGLARFALGSVADRLVRDGATPVLLVRSFTLPVTRLDTALVPLDGSPAAEAALPMVERLAGKPLQAVRLVRAVSSGDDLYEAERYLQTISWRLAEVGLQTTEQVRLGEPGEVIEAESAGMGFVVLATHGRGGFQRLRHGSVAERATRELKVPVLLVRAGVPVAEALVLEAHAVAS